MQKDATTVLLLPDAGPLITLACADPPNVLSRQVHVYISTATTCMTQRVPWRVHARAISPVRANVKNRISIVEIVRFVF
jgi:hypothetical protein